MRKTTLAFALLGLATMIGCGGMETREKNDASEKLATLFEEDWEFRLEEDPLFATTVGDHQADDRLPSLSLRDIERRREKQRELLERLREIDRDDLEPREQVDYDIFERLKEDALAEYRFQTHLMPITNRSGFHISFPELPRRVPLETVEDYENYIARLAGFERYARDHIELLRRGISEGMVLPGIVLEGYEQAIEAHIVGDPRESRLHEPFESFPESFTPDERRRLAAAGREAITTSVVPGYRRFLEFMRTEYVPRARDEIAATALPDGKAFYEHRVRRFTTLDVEPREVHEIGLREVARIREEMEEVIRRTGFEGSFQEFVEFLRTDERFYPDSAEAFLSDVAWVLKKMDGKLPELFKTLPRMPYGLEPVPDYIAPKTTTAYYSPPAGDGTRAGIYYLNTYDLGSRPLYEVEALSLHEAVPGHHLQLALQQELEDLPPFRRFSGFTAFVEGWALYAERLGLEVGFYEDPYSNFGRLTYEMWRACRLVVDTGMHYLGWSRRRAIDFMAENTALTIHNITTEVDRYISWPGQALAYKIGELEITELRREAEEALGEGFDVREFHDVVLLGGSVPLDVLAARVRRYIAGAQ